MNSGARRSRHLIVRGHLEFLAHFAAERWVAESSTENDELMLRLLTTHDNTAVGTLALTAYRNRKQLAERWWRLLYLALLWSGLSMLSPRYDDDEDAEIRWKRWHRWFRTRSLSFREFGIRSSIDPLAVAQRIERIEVKQWKRRYAKDGAVFRKEPPRRLSGSLDTHFLKSAYCWLASQ